MRFSNDIYKIIKERTAKRNFEKRIPSITKIDKIMKAGTWGPAIHHFQPWKFIAVLDRGKIDKIVKLMLNTIDIKMPNYMFFPTIRALKTCPVLIAAYNNHEFSSYARRVVKKRVRIAQLAEVSAIAAAIQNMTIVAESIGVSTCWLDLPVLFEKEISKILCENNALVALLAVGYSRERAARAKRKPYKYTISYINVK